MHQNTNHALDKNYAFKAQSWNDENELCVYQPKKKKIYIFGFRTMKYLNQGNT